MSPDPPIRITEAGDAAMLLELESRIDPAINARALAIARTMRELSPAGVRDVVATYRSVAVYFDPLVISPQDLHETLTSASTAVPDALPSRLIEVPVAYGGEHGPDLDAVAGHAGMSAAEVIDRHIAPEYRVFMLGFLPGFAYMGTVEESIAIGRHSTPRLRVPAGSVGIAGRQTGIYPIASPGGWQLLGRTGLPLFDAARQPATFFAPGDRVRFVKTTDAGPSRPAVAGSASPASAHGTRVATVLTPGLLTTIQDSGRWGAQASGVSVSGVMDSVSHRLANLAVGNPADAAVVEATVTGPELRLERPTRIAVAGADLSPQIDAQRVALNMPYDCRGGAIVRFGERSCGARVYIAMAGGIAAPNVMGSRSTHVLTGLGGQVLRSGDTIATGPERAARGSVAVPSRRTAWVVPKGGAKLRVLPGPQAQRFPAASLDVLVQSRFVVSPQSNRMAYRLSGPALPGAGEIVSDATFTGALQVPPSGQPILLMNDRQTVGGYPQIAVVISADLPLAGQLAPGDWVEFAWSSRGEAISALREQESLFAN